MRIHIVQKGDTLWKIARQHGISFEDLKRLNAHLANPDYIVPGMEIILPDTATKGATPKASVKEYAVKEHVKEMVKEQPIKEIPVKELPIKEVPVKEMPIPIPPPVPQPLPQPVPAPLPPYIMPIEMHWTQPTQPVQPMHIDFYNMTQMPDVNVQMDMQLPQAQPIPVPVQMPAPQPIPEPQHITHYVPVPVPVPVHVPHMVHQPCKCHERPPMHHCGCERQHPMHHHHHHCELQTPVPMTQWMQEDMLANEAMPSIAETMPTQQMPFIDEGERDAMEGWRFPESSSCSSSFQTHNFGGVREKTGHGMPPRNVYGGWTGQPPMPYLPQTPGCPHYMMPYQHGWTGQPPMGGSPWMMPYQ